MFIPTTKNNFWVYHTNPSYPGARQRFYNNGEVFMRKSLVALSTVAALGLFACQPKEEAPKQPAAEEAAQGSALTDMSVEQKQAYAMGAGMGIFVNNLSLIHI